MNIAVLGAGAWGTALAISLAERHDVTLWARDAAQAAAMRETRRNRRYLPDIALPGNLALSDDLQAVLESAQLIVVAVPVSGLRATLQQICAFYEADASASPLLNPLPQAGEEANDKSNLELPGVIWLCKGFETETSLLPHQIVNEILPAAFPRGALTGPSFAQEVARGLPTALTLASNDGEFAQRTAKTLHHSRLRIYSSTDVVGVEIGGAIKNVLAIAAGICDGMQMGLNARAALLTRGLAEMTRLGLLMGGKAETLGGLSGVGDLILTCTGDLSRNRRLGLALGRGQSIADAVREIGQVVESIQTADEVMRQAEAHGVELPIASNVRDVLHGDITPAEGLKRLMAREQKAEYPQALFG